MEFRLTKLQFPPILACVCLHWIRTILVSRGLYLWVEFVAPTIHSGHEPNAHDDDLFVVRVVLYILYI